MGAFTKLTMETKKIHILELIPQRPPFVFVDELTHYDPIITKTVFTVRGDCLLLENGRLAESGIVENMAQSCAARIGYISKFILQDAIRIGYIGAIKKMSIQRLPLVGETLLTTIELLGEGLDMTLVRASVELREELIAECEMKIALVKK